MFCPQNRTPLSDRRKQFPPCQSCQYLFIAVSWSGGCVDTSAHGPPTPSSLPKGSGIICRYIISFQGPQAFYICKEKKGARLGPGSVWDARPNLQVKQLSRTDGISPNWDLCSEISLGGLRVLFYLKLYISMRKSYKFQTHLK